MAIPGRIIGVPCTLIQGNAMPGFDLLMLLGFFVPGAVICAIHRRLVRGRR